MLHTYITKIKSKSFIISTAITLLFITGFIHFDRIIQFFEASNDQPVEIAVLDETNELYQLLEENVQQYVTISLAPFIDTEEAAAKKVEEGLLEGYVILTYDEELLPQAVYKANTIVEQMVPMLLEQALQHIKEGIITSRFELDEEQIAKLYEPVSFERVALMETAKTETELNQARIFVYILLFVIYFTVILFGNLIATEIATEKSSRVMELLITSSSPLQQMFGKIFGIALIGITQYLLIFIVGLASLKQRITNGVEEMMMGQVLLSEGVPYHLIGYAFLFFLLGYFLYATIAAMLGSLVSRIEDVNQLIMPLNMLIIAAFFIAMFGLNSPESQIITFTSYVPFFTPMIMFLRVGMLALPVWEIYLAIVILLASIILFALIGARVYRGGVLMYGKSSSLKDVKQAFQLAKKEK